MNAPDAAHEARERVGLLPCPFCGGSEVELAQTSHFWITCECGVEGPSSKTEDGATTAWNHRAFSAAMQAREARIAELEAALKPFAARFYTAPHDAKLQDDQVIECFTRNEVPQIDLRVADFRKARAALFPASQSEPTS